MIAKKLMNKYYEMLLEKILSNPRMIECMKITREMYPDWSQMQIELDTVDAFFNSSYELIFSINEIYEEVKEHMLKRVEEIISDKTNIDRKIEMTLEDIAYEKLSEIQSKIEAVIREKYGGK